MDRLGTEYGKADVSLPDTDAGVDDSGVDSGDSATVYNDIRNPDFWDTCDITNNIYKLAHDFVGGVFDGQYIYLSPSTSGVVARYEVGKELCSSDAWKVFDTGTLGTQGFYGAVFDGRWVYFVPFEYGGSPHGNVAGFDTQSSLGFEEKTSWRNYDLSLANSGAAGFAGGVFDGQYVYLVPYKGRIVMRHDKSKPFDAGWDGVNVTTVSGDWRGATTFAGGIFDGRSIYLVPGTDDQNVAWAAQYNIQGDFQGGGWDFFDTRPLDPGAYYFFGGAFDGQHWYLSPYRASSPSVVAQYATGENFHASWRTYDLAAVDPDAKAFMGAAFDGRYVYFVPSGASKRLVTRYDTGAEFRNAESWSKFDVQSKDPAAPPAAGAVFDGRYLYFVPSYGGIVARFDAKNPPAMPNLPAFHGSFL